MKKKEVIEMLHEMQIKVYQSDRFTIADKKWIIENLIDEEIKKLDVKSIDCINEAMILTPNIIQFAIEYGMIDFDSNFERIIFKDTGNVFFIMDCKEKFTCHDTIEQKSSKLYFQLSNYQKSKTTNREKFFQIQKVIITKYLESLDSETLEKIAKLAEKVNHPRS